MGKPSKRQGRGGGSTVMGRIGTVLLSFFLICVITGCIVVCVLTVYIFKYLGEADDVDLTQAELSLTTILYAPDESTGEYIELKRITNDENRIWVDLVDMPQHLVDAAIAAEDERFMEHHGVDWKRTFAAFINQFIPILPGTQGGSTITQQVVKNVTGDDAFRVERKVREIFRALNLEKRYSKSQIMETYLNIIGLGHNCAGVQAASNYYFGKDVGDLSIAESAALIAITKSPTANDPLRYPENNKARRDWIIENMCELGFISEEERDEALNEELVLNEDGDSGGQNSINTVNTWFEDYVIDRVIADLMEQKGMTYSEASNYLFQGGLRIYTTVDQEMQTYLEDFYADEANFPAVYNETYPQGAFIITDLNGKILAMAGGMGEKEQSRIFNRATDAKRQPGSAIKPIASYPVALEQNLITWSSMIVDEPVWDSDDDGEPDRPRDHYGDWLRTPITVDYAIRRSTNTIPAKLVDAIGPDVIFNFMKNSLHVDSLVEGRENAETGIWQTDVAQAPLSIGALTDGMTLLEMAGAYQMIGNGGTYTEPYCYTKVLDSQGEVVLEADTTPTRVISAETATLLNRLLQRVTTGAQATGTTAKLTNFPVAGKTGTSDNDYNQWFAGISPYYIGICWMGYDEEETISYASYGPPIIWKSVMEPLHADLPAADFTYSNQVVAREFCSVTGALASDDCEQTETGWYSVTNLPDECGYCADPEEESITDYLLLSDDYDPEPDEDEDEDEDDRDSRSNRSSSRNSRSSSRDDDEEEAA